MRYGSKVEMGYQNAYDSLLIITQKILQGKKLTQSDKLSLKFILNDFQYCINQTKKAEKFKEAMDLLKEASLEEDHLD